MLEGHPFIVSDETHIAGHLLWSDLLGIVSDVCWEYVLNHELDESHVYEAVANQVWSKYVLYISCIYTFAYSNKSTFPVLLKSWYLWPWYHGRRFKTVLNKKKKQIVQLKCCSISTSVEMCNNRENLWTRCTHLLLTLWPRKNRTTSNLPAELGYVLEVYLEWLMIYSPIPNKEDYLAVGRTYELI